MKKLFVWVIAVVVVNVSIVPGQAQAQTSQAFLQSRFDSYDKDSDGQITKAEWHRPLLLRRLDQDGDGALDIKEFRTAIELAVDGRSSKEQATEPWQPATFAAKIPAEAPITKESVLAAAQYSAAEKGISFLVMYDGKTIYADYPNGGSPNRALELASGTKSFTGVMAIAAIEDGLIDSLDEKVCDTITEWKNDPRKSQITVRNLLNLSSGIAANSLGSQRVPSYALAIESETKTKAGEKFEYGPVHFQCFGEFMRRKLKAHGSSGSPLDYLQRRIFDPLELRYQSWRKDEDGNPHLPSGASLTASAWAIYGEFIRLGGTWNGKQVIAKEALDQCFAGSPTNPSYGLTFWLNKPVTTAQRRSTRQVRFATDDLTSVKKIPADLVFAAGAGKQRLYISRDAKLVVVRQAEGIIDALSGKHSGYSDVEFLSRLMK
ncbi:serine hydrolase [Novipirellula herctigrandis]|uniref:serine hydrolase n=1 Tax=Novipirellula herctigrandis TaxID=2527986 RepID=UPI003AF40031